jgi:hypothetical protein
MILCATGIGYALTIGIKQGRHSPKTFSRISYRMSAVFGSVKDVYPIPYRAESRLDHLTLSSAAELYNAQNEPHW